MGFKISISQSIVLATSIGHSGASSILPGLIKPLAVQHTSSLIFHNQTVYIRTHKIGFIGWLSLYQAQQLFFDLPFQRHPFRLWVCHKSDHLPIFRIRMNAYFPTLSLHVQLFRSSAHAPFTWVKKELSDNPVSQTSKQSEFRDFAPAHSFALHDVLQFACYITVLAIRE